MRILHLIDPAAPGHGEWLVQLLADTMRLMHQHEHHVLLLGPGDYGVNLNSDGARSVSQHNPALANPAFAAGRLRRMIGECEAPGQRVDLVQCWSPRTLMLAQRAAGGRRVIGALAAGPATELDVILLRSMLHVHPRPLLCATRGVRSAWRNAHVPEEFLLSMPALINEPVNGRSGSEPLRRSWNCNPGTFVIGAIDCSPHDLDVLAAAIIAARVSACGRDVRLVVQAGGKHRARAEALLRNLQLPHLMIEDAQIDNEMYIGAIDAALVGIRQQVQQRGVPLQSVRMRDVWRRPLRALPPDSPLLGLHCMSAGVPIIVPQGSTIAAEVRDGEDGFVIPQADINAACRVLLELIDEPPRRAAVAAAAQRACAQRFSAGSVAQRMKRIYDSAVNLPLKPSRTDVARWVRETDAQTCSNEPRP